MKLSWSIAGVLLASANKGKDQSREENRVWFLLFAALAGLGHRRLLTGKVKSLKMETMVIC